MQPAVLGQPTLAAALRDGTPFFRVLQARPIPRPVWLQSDATVNSSVVALARVTATSDLRDGLLRTIEWYRAQARLAARS